MHLKVADRMVEVLNNHEYEIEPPTPAVLAKMEKAKQKRAEDMIGEALGRMFGGMR